MGKSKVCCFGTWHPATGTVRSEWTDEDIASERRMEELHRNQIGVNLMI